MLNSKDIASNHFPRINNTPFVGKTLVFLLRTLFHETEYKQFVERYPHLRGLDFAEKVLEYFNFTYTIRDKELNNIPSQGRVVIFANHPIGTLDGLAVLKLISTVRKDVKVIANNLSLNIEPLHSLLLPINHKDETLTEQNLDKVYAHLENEGAVIIFPAGSVSRISPRGVRDEKWNDTFLRIASQTGSALQPVYINARNSWFFYVLSLFAKPLSTLWLIREMFKHQGNVVDMRIGRTISHAQYNKVKMDNKTKTRLLRKHLYRLDTNKKLFFETETAIAMPENRQALAQEIKCGELLGSTNDNIAIYLCNYQADSCLMREIGRLRELTFRMVGEGTGEKRDIDTYDEYYKHLILWDANNLEIAGAYRFGDAEEIIQQRGVEGLYTHTLFSYNSDAINKIKHGLELGRSFVQPKYWGKRSLDYLWFGIGAFLAKNPQYRYLFGPVSLSNNYPKHAQEMLIHFYQKHFGCKQKYASARNPFLFDNASKATYADLFNDNCIEADYRTDFKVLKHQLQHMQLSVPTLYKQYTELTEEGGSEFWGFNIDENFANCVDGLVVVDIDKIKEKKRARYMTPL